ncbi:jg9461 [Pararge aegeria aegeria]|uniref:Jg9461 protein n=1 Tax=Pararge aegeria aegeria TaxID=348720 RepID=A0A8S4RJI7_9NEOP|nr:jg9461 [Pararge aegeria aegeria]
MSAAGSAVAMIGANLRFGSAGATNSSVVNNTRLCPPGGAASAAALLALSGLGISANIALMAVILSKKQLRRWSHGLLFHQAVVDCARAAILLPLGIAVFRCQPVYKCSLVETAFLLLVTVSTVNMLTTVLNDSPIFPENEEEQADLSAPLLMDSPQCVLFGTFMIWFASITINLGPTFLSGALAASAGSYSSYGPSPSCPLVRGPFRHYVLNALWIGVNAVCVGLTLFHLRKLHRDLTKLYFQITLHISYVHAAVNPLLFLALHRALRRAALQLCCGCCVHWSQFVLALTAAAQSPLAPSSFSPAAASPEPPPAPPPPMAPPAPPPHPGPPAPHTMMSWEVEECDAESMSSARVQGDEDMMESWSGSVRRPRSPSPLLPAI